MSARMTCTFDRTTHIQRDKQRNTRTHTCIHNCIICKHECITFIHPYVDTDMQGTASITHMRPQMHTSTYHIYPHAWLRLSHAHINVLHDAHRCFNKCGIHHAHTCTFACTFACRRIPYAYRFLHIWLHDICTHECIHAYMYARTRASYYTRMHTHTFTHTYIYIYIYIYTRIARLYACTRVWHTHRMARTIFKYNKNISTHISMY